MLQPLSLPGRLVSCALGLAVVLTLSWPLGLTGTEPSAEDLRTLPLGDGLERVAADGAGHRFDRRPVRDLAIDANGTVWAVQGRRVVELGQPGAVGPRSQRWGHTIRRLEVTPTGELWASEDGGAVALRVGDGFEDRSDGRHGSSTSLAALSNGQVWRTVRETNGEASVVRSDDGRTWAEVPTAGLEPLLGTGAARYTFAETVDGRVWIGVDRGELGGGLAVFDESGWQVMEDVITDAGLRVQAMEPGPDGSLWVLADVGQPGPRVSHVLVRVGSGEVEVLGETEGMPQETALAWTGWSPLEPSALAIDGSGRVWFSVGDIGLWSYDGVGFDRLDAEGLRQGALDLERAPDGSIWIVGRSGRLYRLDEVLDP